MEKYNKVYKVISIINFALAAATFIYAFVSSFLPYYEGVTFFELGEIYYVLVPLFISGVCSFFAIRFPLFSIPVPVLSIIGGYYALSPFLAEVLVVAMSNAWLGTEMGFYGIGFDHMSSMSGVVIFQIPFVLYAIATFIVRLVDKKKKAKPQENTLGAEADLT